MENSRRYDIPDIGEVTVNKSRRATRVRIAVKPGPQVNVTLPYRTSYEKGLHYILQKKEWIIKSMKRFENMEEEFLVFTPDTEYRTRHHKLEISRTAEERLDFIIEPGITLVRIPESVEVKNPQVQEWIKKAVEETWRIEAKSYLPERVAMWAERYKFRFERVSIRNSKTRWGSCSSTGNINLSLHLMRLPNELIDFVILHELTHTIHKNHGPQFHELLDKICGGKEKEFNRQLRAFKMGDYRMYYQIMK